MRREQESMKCVNCKADHWSRYEEECYNCRKAAEVIRLKIQNSNEGAPWRMLVFCSILIGLWAIGTYDKFLGVCAALVVMIAAPIIMAFSSELNRFKG